MFSLNETLIAEWKRNLKVTRMAGRLPAADRARCLPKRLIGITWHKRQGGWKARLKSLGRTHHAVGTYRCPYFAALVRDCLVWELGLDHPLNFPELFEERSEK